MTLWQRFRKLTFWNKLGTIGSICGILGFFGGLAWWVWDILLDYVFLPFSDWFFGLLTGQHVGESMNDLRPSMDDTIRLLESHLEHDASEQVCVNAAIRLEEIYRTVKKDSKRAQQVVESVREQYPEAPEWERFDRVDDSDEEQTEIE